MLLEAHLESWLTQRGESENMKEWNCRFTGAFLCATSKLQEPTWAVNFHVCNVSFQGHLTPKLFSTLRTGSQSDLLLQSCPSSLTLGLVAICEVILYAFTLLQIILLPRADDSLDNSDCETWVFWYAHYNESVPVWKRHQLQRKSVISRASNSPQIAGSTCHISKENCDRKV